jgi:hypothetical protein
MNGSRGPFRCEQALALLLCLAASPIRAEEPDIDGSRDAAGSVAGSSAYDLDLARRVALDKLKRPGCRSLFADLRDARGTTLEEVLRGESGNVTEHLLRLSYRDGGSDTTCAGGVAAFTRPGSLVVFLCLSRFQELVRRDPFRAGNVLIHEELHTLGFPEAQRVAEPWELARIENPPMTSSQINDLVASRCGR